MDSARDHEAVERILAKRHNGALEMHLRVNGTLLEHHTERQQEDAEDRDAAKLVRICRTEDATDLIATKKDLDFLRKHFLVLVVLCYTVHSMSHHWMFFVWYLKSYQMDVAHAILFAKKIDTSSVTEDYLSAKFELNTNIKT